MRGAPLGQPDGITAADLSARAFARQGGPRCYVNPLGRLIGNRVPGPLDPTALAYVTSEADRQTRATIARLRSYREGRSRWLKARRAQEWTRLVWQLRQRTA